MRRKTIICAFLVVILTFGTAFAADVASIRQRAERGDVKAQVVLGMMYHEGKDVKKDFKEAARWWKMAADKNDPSAQSHLGTLYVLGEGVKKDYGEAIKLYRRAADNGNSEALYNLGTMYANGQGGPRYKILKNRFFLTPFILGGFVIAGVLAAIFIKSVSPYVSVAVFAVLGLILGLVVDITAESRRKRILG